MFIAFITMEYASSAWRQKQCIAELASRLSTSYHMILTWLPITRGNAKMPDAQISGKRCHVGGAEDVLRWLSLWTWVQETFSEVRRGINGLLLKICNSSPSPMGLHLFCKKSSKYVSVYHWYTVLIIRPICHAQDMWKIGMESCKQLHLLCLPDPGNLPGTALLSGFQSSHGALKSTD